MTVKRLSARAALALATCVLTSAALASQAQLPPDPPKLDAQGRIAFVGIKDIEEFKALPDYHEPDWVTANFVAKGKLPPVKERLPDEPLVLKSASAPNGIGVYGDVLRHVIAGRPEGWNFSAGQSQGGGGIDIGLSECLTRTGPLYQVRAAEAEPLPNLAKSWEWSTDGHQLTMHLIKGAKWSDGVPFNADDVLFHWEDIIHDKNVAAPGGASPATFGEKTSLQKFDDNTVVWTFEDAFPKRYLYAMAFGSFCPGPAHLLKPQHPKYSKNSYEQFKAAFPANYMNFAVMGAWVPVEHRPNDIVVLRRNPYYWKVDDKGNQLPYLDEVQYKLSTTADREAQAIAGTGDLASLDQVEGFADAAKRAAQADAPARLEFGPRIFGYSLFLNFSANGWGEPDERAKAVREINRNDHFRKALTMALNRAKLGEAVVKGPFTAIYPGGLYAGTNVYDKASTTYYPFDLAGAAAELEKAGLTDTDGSGYVNFPKTLLGGRKVEIGLLTDTDDPADKRLADAVVAAMDALGIKVTASAADAKRRDALSDAGKFDWMIHRNPPELVTPAQNALLLAPTGPKTSLFHRAGTDGSVDLLPFEKDLVDVANKAAVTGDAKQRAELMKQYQKIYTANVYGIGLTQYPGGLIVNKRFANIPPGAPVFLSNWGEDTLVRERIYVPKDKQRIYELHPATLPGAPGSSGPVQ